MEEVKRVNYHPVVKKIMEEYGTVLRFCRVENINRNTLKVVIHGYGSSKPICEKLIGLGIIEDCSELGKVGSGSCK